MDAKDLIQKAWVIEAMVLLLVVPLACAWMPADRLGALQDMLPRVIALILGQGIAAAGGPELKRWIESRGAK